MAVGCLAYKILKSDCASWRWGFVGMMGSWYQGRLDGGSREIGLRVRRRAFNVNLLSYGRMIRDSAVKGEVLNFSRRNNSSHFPE